MGLMGILWEGKFWLFGLFFFNKQLPGKLGWGALAKLGQESLGVGEYLGFHNIKSAIKQLFWAQRAHTSRLDDLNTHVGLVLIG